MSFTSYQQMSNISTPLLNSEEDNIINNVLLIDNSVKEYQTFVDLVNSSTFPIVYFISSSKIEILTLLQTVFSGVGINRICIIFASNLGNVTMFLDNKPLFDENESRPYSENLQFIIDIIKKFRIKNIDYLICDTLKYQNYLNYYKLIEQNTGVIVGVLDDKTNIINYGVDFVMNSTSQDIKNIYFKRNIEHYSFILNNLPNIKILKFGYDNQNIYRSLITDITNTDPYYVELYYVDIIKSSWIIDVIVLLFYLFFFIIIIMVC